MWFIILHDKSPSEQNLVLFGERLSITEYTVRDHGGVNLEKNV